MRQALLTYLIRVWSTTLSNGLRAAVHIRRMSGKLCVAVAIVLVTFQQAAADEYECGTLDNGLIGPWDYHDPRNHIPNGEAPKGRAKLVENAHFTPIIEACLYASGVPQSSPRTPLPGQARGALSWEAARPFRFTQNNDRLLLRKSIHVQAGRWSSLGDICAGPSSKETIRRGSHGLRER